MMMTCSVFQLLRHRDQLRGDVGYEVSQISSGSVTANTLTVLRRRRYRQHNSDDSSSSSRVFETVLTTEDGTVQYQLQTHVHHQRRGVYLEDIDGPVWLRVPPARVAYSPGAGRLTIECAAVMPVEHTVFSNELILSRATLPMDTPTNLDFSKIVNIHRDTQNLTENQGDTLLLVGRRQMTSSGQVLYHVGVSTRNASASISGHYQCIVERQNDRMFAVATVAAAGRKSPLSHIPLIEIRSCRKESFNRETNELVVRQGQTVCIQCRALADPRPDVFIYHGTAAEGSSHELGGPGRQGGPARTRAGVGVERYVDVASGGVVVAAYTFPPAAHSSSQGSTTHVGEKLPPASIPAGVYHCMANNSHATRRQRFIVTTE